MVLMNVKSLNQTWMRVKMQDGTLWPSTYPAYASVLSTVWSYEEVQQILIVMERCREKGSSLWSDKGKTQHLDELS